MKAGIIGGTGYLGAELVRLLASHPDIDLVAVQGDSSAGQALASLYPGLGTAYRGFIVDAVDTGALSGCDVVFVAVPSGRSQPIVAALCETASLVVDLGADFRLRDASLYDQWYGFHHSVPELLERAVFGLPELNRAALHDARLIAAPGCYVTAASIALAPLVARGVIAPSGIIIDAASGTSGAGKEPGATTHHATVNENFRAYQLLSHRHTPEIEQTIGAQVLFTPHLAPMTRGILATCYARPSGATSTEELIATLEEVYGDEPFVEVGHELPATRETYGSNVVRLTARYDVRTGTVIVLSALDNLTKGGAGQALQAANVALGLAETSGLPTVALLP